VQSTPQPLDELTLCETPPAGAQDDPPARPVPLARGDTLGRYVVLERVGVGGMGEVFAAYDPELDRKIAVKLLRSSSSGSRSAGADRLIREAKAMAKLSHRNVIAVHDVGTHSGHVFVAMEFVDGGTLSDWMREGPHPWKPVLERFKAAGAGLAAAHAQGLVHRDFKPANVLLGSDGRVLVADFGLARRARDEPPERRLIPLSAAASSSHDSLAEPLTQTGVMLGTPAYMAPEQYEGGQVDGRADQFSFCVALYEALYGERPFGGDSLHVLMFAVVQGRIREAPAGNSVPGWLRRVLVRGLAHDPNDRWPSMDALLTGLRRDRARLRRRALVVSGLLGLGLVLAGIGFGQRIGSQRATEPAVCVGAEQALGDAFDASDRAAIEAQFARLGSSSELGETARELLSRLDQRAQDWQAAWLDACRATRVRGDQSEDLLDRRMACLDLQRSRFAALVDTMAQANLAMATRALDLTHDLDTFEGCSDRAALLRQVPLPTQPDRLVAIRKVHGMLEKVRLQQLAGHPREAGLLLEQQRALVEFADWGPLTANFLAAEGWQQILEDQPAEGERLLKRAFATAISVGDDSLARAIARRVAGAGKDEPERAAQSLDWLDLATALAIREGSDDAVLAQLGLVRNQVLITLGDYPQARDAALDALERLTRAEPEGAVIGSALYQLALAEHLLGDDATAITHLDRGAQFWSRKRAPDHLSFLEARSLRGVIAREAGDLAGARATFEAVLAVKLENFGPDSGQTLVTELELARTLAELGDHERARSLAAHVLERRRSRYPANHSLIGATLVQIAAIERHAGELDHALAHALAAETILRAVLAPAHPQLVTVIETRAAIERERGELE